MTHDLIVIGAGQGGGPLAGAFARAGRRVALIERAQVGGTCVNVGCTPTKTMVASARVAHVARRAQPFGVNVGRLEIDLEAVRDRKRAIVESFRKGSERKLETAGVELVRGTARFVSPHQLEVTSPIAETRELSAELVVIDTGTRPMVPAIAGLDQVPVLDSTSVMELETVPEHLIVLGGGSIGTEFAQMFRRFGSRVSLLERQSQLLANEDTDVADAVGRILAEDGVYVVLDAEVSGAERSASGAVALSYRNGEGAPETRIAASHLLVAVGRSPNTDALNLEAAGVEVDERGYVKVNARLETTSSGIFALGDVTGGPQLTHVSYDDYRILRANLLDGGRATTEGRVIPYTIYIDPQLGRVGLTERAAREAGYDVRVATLPMAKVARALEVDETRGFMKAVVDARSQQILGAAVLGIEGGEIASLIQVAMMGHLPYTMLRDGMFAHPTLAESVNNLFRHVGSGPEVAASDNGARPARREPVRA
jgi:pyruvate/2-oxoglutarate dehydrogenase complex dihydrolipoamide dehydrogenase (E3) component